MKRVLPLPSILTLGNFTCGFIVIILCMFALRLSLDIDVARLPAGAISSGGVVDQATLWAAVNPVSKARAEELLAYACLAIFIAMVFDMLDGRVARMTRTESKFGAELDSLADGCTFGVAPAVLVGTLWILQLPPGHQKWFGAVVVCGIVYAACAVLRLARYNVEAEKSDKNYFTGLPSPAAAGAVAGAVLVSLQHYLTNLWAWIDTVVPLKPIHGTQRIEAWGLGFYMMIIGLMMVSRIRFAHLANLFLTKRQRFTYLIVFVFSAALLAMNHEIFLFVAFNLYVAVGVGDEIKRKLTRKVPAVVSPHPADDHAPENNPAPTADDGKDEERP